MTAQAYKFLLQRANNHRPQRKRVRPAAITKAKALIKRYEDDDYTQEVAFRERVEAQRTKVKEVIHAGNYQDALKVIQEFERFKP